VIRGYVAVIAEVAATLEPGTEDITEREEEFEALIGRFEATERWFRSPKSHERRIHGHRHAGIRLVLDGSTSVPALDAHAAHPGPFTVDDLLPYRTAREPPCQTEARNRRTIMRKARSKKNRPLLLAELERRYREMPGFQLFRGPVFFIWRICLQTTPMDVSLI
jgi:hypothetical protein